MSIDKKKFSRRLLLGAQILLAALACAAQDLEATVVVNRSSPDIAQINGRLLKQTRLNWFFAKNAARADNLGVRIADFQLFDANNRLIAVKKFAVGEYLAETEAVGFQYQINLAPASNAATKAHVSWISGEQGMLMLDDLLPQISASGQPVSAKIKLELPNDWRIISGEKSVGANVFQVENAAESIFVVGVNWREAKTANLNLAISGEWRFEDAEAARAASEIYEVYAKMFGAATRGKPQIVLARLPKEAKFGRWEAETRGGTATIFSADQPFKAQSIQLLHEQLRHELLHLWIPNGLNLNGDYDWFYEGFTVYQALRTGLQMNQIRFEDFLATLAEAHRLDAFQARKISLIESSANRWNAVDSAIYARGMLVAFLCDLAILKDGGGKRSIENILQDVYRTHRFPQRAADGSAAVLKILRNYKSLDSIIVKYIEGAEKIDWESDLEIVGIEAKTENSFVKLRVKSKLNGRQKDLLDELGYNNWRKISRETR